MALPVGEIWEHLGRSFRMTKQAVILGGTYG